VDASGSDHLDGGYRAKIDVKIMARQRIHPDHTDTQLSWNFFPLFRCRKYPKRNPISQGVACVWVA